MAAFSPLESASCSCTDDFIVETFNARLLLCAAREPSLDHPEYVEVLLIVLQQMEFMNVSIMVVNPVWLTHVWLNHQISSRVEAWLVSLLYLMTWTSSVCVGEPLVLRFLASQRLHQLSCASDLQTMTGFAGGTLVA